MLNKFLYIIIFAGFAVLSSMGAGHAQQCDVSYEMITKLYHPYPGSYTVWDSTYGEEKKDEWFSSVVNHGDGGVLAVVQAQAIREGVPSMVFVSFDKRGRKVWDKYHSISGLNNIVKMLPRAGGVVVLANRQKPGGKSFLWLGFFDDNARLKSQKIIRDKKHGLFATDIIHGSGDLSSKKGWAISVTVDGEYGAVYLLDKNGNELSNRNYIIGSSNKIEGLSVSKTIGEKSGYIATGSFENQNGKKIGLVMLLNGDLSYIWQKEYSRGLSANVKYSSSYADKYILAFGEVMPASSKPAGSWIMLLDKINGKVMWQRYYYGESGVHDYLSSGLYVRGDGLITLMMAADLVGDNDDGYMSYAHLLTLSPRGVTLSGDSYYYGKGAYISQLIEGANGSRIMAGYSLVSAKDAAIKDAPPVNDGLTPLKEMGVINLPNVELSDETNAGLAMLKNKIKDMKIDGAKDISTKESANVDNGSNELSKDGWVVIGEMPEAYSDPCLREVRKLK